MNKENSNKKTIFNLVTPFEAAGDQPRALKVRVDGFNAGKTKQT